MTETNDYSSSESLGYTLQPADEPSRLRSQTHDFSADVCNYSADLSNGSEVTSHMTPPLVSAETTAITKPRDPRVQRGEAVIVWLLMHSAFSFFLYHVFITADISDGGQTEAHDRKITQLDSNNMLLPSLPR